ncbi:MAG TPA: GAF domain-containing protein [Ktedonobacterales bacterium]
MGATSGRERRTPRGKGKAGECDVLNVYQPIPRDLFAATPPLRSRRTLRFFMTWYEAVAGAIILSIMALLIAPTLRRLPIMGLWLLAYALYLGALVAIARAPGLRGRIHAAADGAARWLVWLLYGRPDSADAPRGLALIQVCLALALTFAAFLFIVSLGLAYRVIGLPPSTDVASWLLFVLPILRVARYAALPWIGVVTALALAADGAARLLVAGGADGATLRIVALHACWLILVSLLPAVTLRSLSEGRARLASAISVVRALSALQPTSERDFANAAAALIAQRMGYDEVNVLLATSGDDAIGRGLRFLGAASPGGRELAQVDYLIEQAQGITGWAAIHGQERLVNDVERDPHHLYLRHPTFPHTSAELALPLTLGGAVIGVLDVQSECAYAFGEDDVELLRAIALHLAIALDNAQRLTRARGLASVTQRIARRLLSQQDLRAALEQVVMTARETLRADSVALYPCDPEDGRIGEPVVSSATPTAPASAKRVTDRGAASAVMQGLQAAAPIYANYSASDAIPGSFVAREGVRAAAILPLRVGEGATPSEVSALGVIFVNYHTTQAFSQEYREWCAALADLAALALQSAMLYQNLVEEERANTWSELHDGMGQDAGYGRMLLEQALATIASGAALTPLDHEKLINAHQFVCALQRQVNYLMAVWGKSESSDLWRESDDEEVVAGGLFDDLDEHATLVRRTLEMRCVVNREGDDSAISGSLRHDARMVAREAIYNAYRHGRASEVVVDAEADADGLRLRVRDNGCGFDARRVSKLAHGMSSIRRRAERHGGAFTIQSEREPGRSGTTVEVIFRVAVGASPVESVANIA